MTDRGQRYEVRVTGWPKPEQTAVAHTFDRANALRLACGFAKAPGCSAAEIADRVENCIIEIQR